MGCLYQRKVASGGSFDYASQEPRWLAHYCASIKNPHPAINEVVELYKNDDADFHQMVADLAGITRKEAKTVNLGIMYGMGRKKLAGVMDITEEEAKVLLANYHEKVPFVKGIADMAAKQAEKFGHIRTMLGRKCRFDLWEPKSYGIHQATATRSGGKGIRWCRQDSPGFYIQGAEQADPSNSLALTRWIPARSATIW